MWQPEHFHFSSGRTSSEKLTVGFVAGAAHSFPDDPTIETAVMPTPANTERLPTKRPNLDTQPSINPDPSGLMRKRAGSQDTTKSKQGEE
jgi:hypothetical protein